MTERSTLIIHLDPPDSEGGIPLKLNLIRLTPDLDTRQANPLLKLPFPLAKIPLFLRALNARQYPDYPGEERRLINTEEERDYITAFLRSFGMWDDARNCVIFNVHKSIGLLLGNALLALPEFKDFLNALYETAVQASGGEIIFSFHPNAISLAALPWEVTYLPDSEQPMLFTKGVVLSCTRLIAFDHTLSTLRTNGERLRVLTLAPIAGMDDAGRAFERLARGYLRERLRNFAFDIEALPRTTLKDLHERLGQDPPVDILDYYGHGVLTSDGTELLMDGENGGIARVSCELLQSLGSLLPPVIILHACQSASINMDSPLASFATGLSSAGVRAVLAMQLVAPMPAITYDVIPTFYQEVAAGESLQLAVAKVRHALRFGDANGTSWYLPTLYLRQKDQSPFRLRRRTEPPANPFIGPGAFRNAKRFVGRESQLRRMWGFLKAGASFTIVGVAGSGKSSMLRFIAEEAPQYLDPKIKVIQLPVSSNADTMKMDLAKLLGGEHPTDLIRLLHHKHIILLLDNLDQLEQDEEGLKVRNWMRSQADMVLNQVVQLVATSREPPNELYKDDRPRGSSSLVTTTLLDKIELKDFNRQEAQLFIETSLAGTPFKLEQFVNILNGSLMPGALKQRCKERYDELAEGRDW